MGKSEGTQTIEEKTDYGISIPKFSAKFLSLHIETQPVPLYLHLVANKPENVAI